ncbi:MAG TPA: class I SAM-dependent methyltransferase [Acidimicrobiia bacterium]|nr:class I SAM-dependent methyltransferase [Acidimicrobiia bacterium]
MEPDYDRDPERFRTGQRVTARYARADLYAEIAGRLHDHDPILDVGCGEGALAAARPGVIGLDRSPTMLAAAPPPTALGDAVALPFPDACFGAVVTVNVLYHLPEPARAIEEARRVLRRGGIFAAATVARDDSPELAHVWRAEPTSFDAEEAPGIVASVFGEVDVDAWDAPLVHLPDHAAVRDYLIARFVPSDEATRQAAAVPVPVDVTKRGCVVYGRR